MLFLFTSVKSTEGYFLDEILWVEASGSYCVIYMEDGAEITVSYPLDRVFNNDLPFIQI